MMKIQILCPECGLVLKDKFECPSSRVTIGGYLFNLECYKCEKYFDVYLVIEINKNLGDVYETEAEKIE